MADNQHYISQAHLRQFIHPKAGQNVLFPYAKGGGPQRPRGTSTLASAIDFYVYREAGKPTNELDERRKRFETEIFASGKRTPGTLAQCIYDDKFELDSAKAGKLAQAASFLHCGSPVEIHNHAMIGLVSYQAHALNRLNADDAVESYRERHGDKAEEQIEADRDALLSGELRVDVEDWKHLGFDSFQFIDIWAQALNSMSLTIVDAYGNDFFVTSDNPVVTHSPRQPNNPGMAVKDATVWFPISYKRALLWHHRTQHPPREVFSTRQTRVQNKLMLKWCYKFIYSPLPDPWIEAAAKEESFNPCYGHYGTLKDFFSHAAPAFMPGGAPAGEIIEVGSALRASPQMDMLGI